jgi:hypothetical protein
MKHLREWNFYTAPHGGFKVDTLNDRRFLSMVLKPGPGAYTNKICIEIVLAPIASAVEPRKKESSGLSSSRCVPKSYTTN